MLNKDMIKAIIVALEFRERTLTAIENQTPELKTGLYNTRRALSLMRDMVNGDTIASLWSVEDVYGLLTDVDTNEVLPPDAGGVTRDEARKVLELADSEHDASIGINWYTLEANLEYVRNSNAS